MQVKKRSVKFAAVLAAGLITLSLPGYQVAAAADTASESALIQEKENIAASLAVVEEEIFAYQAQRNSLQSRLDALQAENVGAQEDYDRLSAELQLAEEELSAAINNHQTAEATLAAKEAEYNDRILTMLPYRDKSTFEVLLTSGSLTGFFTTMRLMDYIAASDADMVRELDFARDAAEIARREAVSTADEAEAFFAYAETQLANYANQIELTELDLNSVQGQLLNRSADAAALETQGSAINQELDDFYARQAAAAREAEAARIAEEARVAEEARLAEEARVADQARQAQAAAEQQAAAAQAQEESNRQTTAASKAPESTGGSPASNNSAPAPQVNVSFNPIWPLSGGYYVSSYYGYRMSGFHKGIDLATNGRIGDPVRAIAAGTVVLVHTPLQGQSTGWDSTGYGNYVTVLHANGVTSTYAHLSYAGAYQGQQVSAGDYLGDVGSTGISTGPHLHLEIAVNGRVQNPLNYLP